MLTNFNFITTNFTIGYYFSEKNFQNTRFFVFFLSKSLILAIFVLTKGICYSDFFDNREYPKRILKRNMSKEGISPSQFEQVFREQYSRLYYYANDFVQDDEAARDIVSDVFTAVWNERGRMMATTLPAYLMTSVRNQSINYLRKNTGRESFEPSEAMASLMADSEEDLSTLNERLDKLQNTLNRLPEKTRFVIEECYYRDKKYSEVAHEMGITPDGVKKHVVKAFRLLRESFGIKLRADK